MFGQDSLFHIASVYPDAKIFFFFLSIFLLFMQDLKMGSAMLGSCDGQTLPLSKISSKT